MRKYVIIGILFLCVVVSGIVYYIIEINKPKIVFEPYEEPTYEPYAMFELYFGFEIPDSAVIGNFDHYEPIRDEHCVFYKIAISESDYSYVKDLLLAPGSVYYNSVDFESAYIPTHLTKKCKWWDLNQSDVLISFCRWTRGRLALTRSFYVSFSQDASGQYYMYAAG